MLLYNCTTEFETIIITIQGGRHLQYCHSNQGQFWGHYFLPLFLSNSPSVLAVHSIYHFLVHLWLMWRFLFADGCNPIQSIDRSFVCFGSLKSPHFPWEGFSDSLHFVRLRRTPGKPCGCVLNWLQRYFLKFACLSFSSGALHAHRGFKKDESLMNSSLWVEDFTSPFYGRYFTLNLKRRIIPDYENDQIFLHLQRQTNFTIFIYHSKFFLLNSNLLSFPMIIKQVSSSMGNHYWCLAVTERFELNHPSDPCFEGKFAYRCI